MRRSLTILLLCCSLGSFALVPPRDPSKWTEWQVQHIQTEQSTFHVNRLPAATQAVGTRTIIPRILVIMANFPDAQLISSKADVDSMFNARNWTKDGATGSIRQYFYDQSMGTYDPQFDIVGPVMLDSSYTFYGKGQNGSRYTGYMVTEACMKVDNEVDFTLYDSDNDGKVDLVYVFFAGFGENDPPRLEPTLVKSVENLIWPAYWNVNSAGYGTNKCVFDGKRIYAFEYSNELDGYYSTSDNLLIAGIGVACHEYGHALGLPDMYNYSHNEKTLGAWDIMDYGPYNNDMHTPPSFSAYERFFMGWLTPELITEADTYELENIAVSNKAYLVSESDTHNMNGVNPDPNQFYLLENRQRTGWDIAIPGDGMMLTYINDPAKRWNSINRYPADYAIDIIEADGLQPTYIEKVDNGYKGKPGDLFPEGATEYLGITDHAITDITMTDGVVSFKYRGGKPTDPTSIEAPVTNPLSTYKTIQNGQLLIHVNGQTYNIYGIQQ